MRKLIAKIFLVILVLAAAGSFFLALVPFNKYVACVRGSTGQMHDIETKEATSQAVEIGDSFDKYFKNPKWHHLESGNWRHIVEFNGECDYDGKPAKAKIQFIISQETRVESILDFKILYRVGAIAIDDKILTTQERMDFLDKIINSK